MRTFAQKSKPTLPASRSHSTLSRPSYQSNHTLLRSFENSATRPASPAHGPVLEAESPATASPRFAHDFSRIPVHAAAPAILQTKLQVNTPGDAYEQEAERVAEQVMRMPEPHLPRTGADGSESSGTVNPQAPPVCLQTQRIQVSDTWVTVAPPIVHEVLRSSGQPLDPATRAFMEPRFGHDFSRVQVYADASAEQSAREVNAHAYTVGNSVVFGAGRFAPETSEGRRLIAHELTHVVQQQTASGATSALQRQALSYESTAITIPPLPQGFTLIASQNLVDKAKKATPPKLTSAGVKGVTPASNEEIYLYYIIAQVANADNWGTEHDLIAPIGWPAKPGGAVPVGKVTVIIDSAGGATAELLSAGGVPTPTTYKSAAAAITALKTTYGITKVTDDSAKWTPDELNKVVAAFALVRTGDRAALKGVELIRVDSLGGDTAGEFDNVQSVADTTVVNTATLKLANKAFEGDPVSFVGDAGNASPASYLTIVHEVAHAIEKKARRDAVQAHHQAIAKSNVAANKQNEAVGVLNPLVEASNALVDEFNNATTAAEQAKIKPKLDAAKAKVAAARKTFDAAKAKTDAAKKDAEDKEKLAAATLLSDAATTALKTDSQAKKTSFDTALALAQTTAGQFIAADSTAAASFIQTVSAATKAIGDYVTAAALDDADVDAEDEKVLKAFEKRDDERTALLKAAPKNPAPGAFGAAVVHRRTHAGTREEENGAAAKVR